MKLPWRKFAWILTGLLLGAALIWAFLPQPVPVDLAPVQRGLLRVTIDEEGKTRIRQKYVLSAPLMGQMRRIELRPGDRVLRGQTLIAVIDPVDPALLDARTRSEAEARVKAATASRDLAETRLRAAKKSLDLASRNFQRAKRLLPMRSIAREEYDLLESREFTAKEDVRSAEQSLQVAVFELELARAALLRTRPTPTPESENGHFEIRSPIEGKVLRVHQESSIVVTPGMKLVEVGDPTDLEVEVEVLSHDAVKIPPHAQAFLEHWGGPQPLLARVRLVEPAAFLKISALGVEEQRVNVILDLLDPVHKRPTLGDAYRVEARIVLWEGQNVLKVPSGALFRQDGGWAVFAVRHHRALLCPLQIGWSNGLETEVLAGLDETDQVIVHPGDRVLHGVAIRPR